MVLSMTEAGESGHVHLFSLTWKDKSVWGDIVTRKIKGRRPIGGILLSTVDTKTFIPLFPVIEKNSQGSTNGFRVRLVLNTACFFSYRATKIRRLAQAYGASDWTIVKRIFGK